MFSKKSFAYLLAVLIITIAAVMRISAITSEAVLTPDSIERYEPIAKNLVAGNGFSKSSEPPYLADGFEQPAYPYFVATIYGLTAGSRKAVVVTQVLVEIAVVLLVFYSSSLLGLSRRAQITALVIAALCPFLPLFSRNLLTEVLATFLITLAYYLALLAVSRKSLNIWIGCAAAGGICLLVRPDLLISVSLLPVAIVLLGRLWKWQQGAYRVAIFAFVVLAVLTPWTIRNYLTFHTFSPLGQVTRQTKLAYAQWLDTWLDDPRYIEAYWWHAIDKSYAADFKIPTLSDEERIRAGEALALAKEQGYFDGQPAQEFAALTEQAKQERPFFTYMAVPLRRTIKTFFFLPSYINNRWLKAVTYLFWIALLIGSTLGLLLACRRKKLMILTLCSLLLGRSVLPMISALAVEPRYMLEALPALFILTASLVDYRSDFIKKSFVKTKQEQLASA